MGRLMQPSPTIKTRIPLPDTFHRRSRTPSPSGTATSGADAACPLDRLHGDKNLQFQREGNLVCVFCRCCSLTTKQMGRTLRQEVGEPGRRRYRQAVQKAARLLAATHAVPARNLTSVTPSPHNITRKGIELVTAGKPAKPHASHNVSKICRTCAQKSDYQVPR